MVRTSNDEFTLSSNGDCCCTVLTVLLDEGRSLLLEGRSLGLDTRVIERVLTGGCTYFFPRQEPPRSSTMGTLRERFDVIDGGGCVDG